MSKLTRMTMLGLWMALGTMQAAAQGYRIEVKADGFAHDTLLLGYYLGDKQYVRDTTVRRGQSFVFEGREPLPPGMYMLVFPPENQFVQFLVDKDDQRFALRMDFADLTHSVRVRGSAQNEAFQRYLSFLEKQRLKAEDLRKQLEQAEDEATKQSVEKQLKAIDEEVKNYQLATIGKHPGTLLAKIVEANLPLDVPEFEGEDAQFRKWQWAKKHYFDHIDLAAPGLLRTPFLQQRVDYYVDKMIVQHPDSINAALDTLLERMRPAPETFQYFLVHFLNKYARSKIVGMDAVYVHLALAYYATGQAPWTDEETLEKILDNARKLEPLLIGKIAPDIRMQTRDGRPVSLHEFESPYTVLFFWDPDCGHCKKSMPDMIGFYNQFKDRGVEIFGVCTKFYNEADKCWNFVDEKGIGIWLNTIDPYHQSKYKTIYDIRSTPQIYVLDKDKRILVKRIGAKQLPEVMEQILKNEGEETEARGQ